MGTAEVATVGATKVAVAVPPVAAAAVVLLLLLAAAAAEVASKAYRAALRRKNWVTLSAVAGSIARPSQNTCVPPLLSPLPPAVVLPAVVLPFDEVGGADEADGG
jgi:hypothetical protein